MRERISEVAGLDAAVGRELDAAEPQPFVAEPGCEADVPDARERTIEPAKLADLVALSVDPFAASPTEVRDAKVLLTMVGGRIVHDGLPRRSEAPPQREAAGFTPADGCSCAEPHA